MRILLLGKSGQIGWELQRTLAPLGEVIALGHQDLDLSLLQATRKRVRQLRPALIVNAAAFTAVDKAESEPELAGVINGLLPGVLAEEACRLGGGLVHYSSDYVFDGETSRPYTEQDRPNPINVYGKTKLEGETAIRGSGCIHLILRTSWVYSLRGRSFPIKVLDWARTQRIVRVVDDQVGSPTWSRMIAEVTALALARGAPDGPGWLSAHSGLYHLAGAGCASRFEWAKLVLELDPNPEEQRAESIVPARSQEFPTPARRPAFSALDCSLFFRTFGIRPPAWQDSIRQAMQSP